MQQPHGFVSVRMCLNKHEEQSVHIFLENLSMAQTPTALDAIGQEDPKGRGHLKADTKGLPSR